MPQEGSSRNVLAIQAKIIFITQLQSQSITDLQHGPKKQGQRTFFAGIFETL